MTFINSLLYLIFLTFVVIPSALVVIPFGLIVISTDLREWRNLYEIVLHLRRLLQSVAEH